MSMLSVRKSALGGALAVSLALGGGAVLAVILPSVPATAQSAAAKAAVDAAKARGEVGEQGDGYLGFVNAPTNAALAQAVAEINAGREQAYREIAMRTNTSVQAAGEATAQQLFSRLPPGQYYRPLNGNWTRKS
jgi:uncharacterized protein YdbL (DUF1318 family)